MPVNFHAWEHRLHLATRVDDIGGPHDAHALSAVKIFLLPGPISLESLVIGVAGEREIQFKLVAELCQLFRRVGAYANNPSSELVQVFLGITKLVSLTCSTWRISLWKEVKDQGVPFEVTQLDRLASVR